MSLILTESFFFFKARKAENKTKTCYLSEKKKRKKIIYFLMIPENLLKSYKIPKTLHGMR